MAEKQLSEEQLTRDEAADRLRALADELEGDGSAQVRTGNKTVELRPPTTIAYEVGIRERSSILRGGRETVTIKMDWKPANVSEESTAAE
ncbi:amphi-Trp domain-containing protein [Natrinema salsiterrestre]|uniref:Amphi-Trp domain-containing protein n=1 Tax=Natrinema salsiterrestre TaxID=2950540 RepID=A0A9Q4Q2X9_9EURY|nr:amphi-Trp domain-containing protein [Natrinema salsiterrestre]MDF9746956.1 amphi-Trp domain-containing protein [Natrinema salsiterrestre]